METFQVVPSWRKCEQPIRVHVGAHIAALDCRAVRFVVDGAGTVYLMDAMEALHPDVMRCVVPYLMRTDGGRGVSNILLTGCLWSKGPRSWHGWLVSIGGPSSEDVLVPSRLLSRLTTWTDITQGERVAFYRLGEFVEQGLESIHGVT